MEQQKLTEPKRERKFISQTDFLRVIEYRNKRYKHPNQKGM